MTTATERRTVRALSLWWLAMLTLLAVFSMHGPSSGHSMIMPGSSGHHAAMAADQSMSGPAPRSSRSAAVVDHRMTHGECVATLRSDPGHLVPAAAVVATHIASAADQWIVPSVREDRGPPRPPDLEELCISRT